MCNSSITFALGFLVFLTRGAMGQSIDITCSGICPPSEGMLNAATDVRIGDTLATCGFFDEKAKETIDAEVCTEWQEDATAAGCKCGVPIECGGICPPSEEMLNAATDVRIGDTLATCGFFDEKAKETIDAEVCTEWQEDATAAGCKCGVPIECGGICPPSEEMLNAATDVRIGDTLATCGFFDEKAKETIDSEVCTEWQEDAAAAGCKCGVPIECGGICPPSEEMLNAATDVRIGDTLATCGFFDEKAKETIDSEVCTEWQEDATAAGCKCGVPIECPGICDAGETLVNRADDVTICGNVATCGFFDERNTEVVDAEVCSQNAENARVAGCNCSGVYPDDEKLDCSTNAGAGLFISTWAVVSSMVAVGVATA